MVGERLDTHILSPIAGIELKSWYLAQFFILGTPSEPSEMVERGRMRPRSNLDRRQVSADQADIFIVAAPLVLAQPFC
jgi:hypothetical protein